MYICLGILLKVFLHFILIKYMVLKEIAYNNLKFWLNIQNPFLLPTSKAKMKNPFLFSLKDFCWIYLFSLFFWFHLHHLPNKPSMLDWSTQMEWRFCITWSGSPINMWTLLRRTSLQTKLSRIWSIVIFLYLWVLGATTPKCFFQNFSSCWIVLTYPKTKLPYSMLMKKIETQKRQ